MDDYPIQLEVPVAWGDMDAFAHVNNTIYFRWFESARIALFRRVGWTQIAAGAGVGPILAKTQCVFRRPLVFPDTITVGVRVEDLAEDRFTTVYRVDSAQAGPEAATGDGRIVSFDYGAGKKAPIPEDVYAALASLGG